jgi:hypothetical protein
MKKLQGHDFSCAARKAADPAAFLSSAKEKPITLAIN